MPRLAYTFRPAKTDGGKGRGFSRGKETEGQQETSGIDLRRVASRCAADSIGGEGAAAAAATLLCSILRSHNTDGENANVYDGYDREEGRRLLQHVFARFSLGSK